MHKNPTPDNTDRLGREWDRPRAIGPGYYAVLFRILDMNFREYLFYALG
jgi:hypothetical protein